MYATVIRGGEAFRAGRRVEAHHRRKQNGVGYAVGDMIFSAQRVAERMDGRCAAGSDSHARVKACELHG